MAKPHENQIYIVSLSEELDSIEKLKNNKYSMPVGHRYLSYPPEYMGFRYDCKLQRISHVDKVGYFYDSRGFLNFEFELGPNLLDPSVCIKPGKGIQDARKWVDFDLLFEPGTTIVKAAHKTKLRHSNN